MKGRLSKGKIEGNIVTCPRRGSQFDLRNGESIRWLSGSGILYKMSKVLKSPKRLKIYKVISENENI
jgi:nitrite reductase/ring-hydroxylating ferredoxin subunit